MTAVRFWDLAATANAGCYSCGTKMAKVGDYYYILDVVRGQWSPHERDQIILQTAVSDGYETQIVVEQEPGSAGVSVIDSLVRLLAGFTVRGDRPSGQKAVRAMPLASMAEAGYVVLVRGRWNSAFLDELSEFPNGKFKDQVDSASGAFSHLASAPSLPFSWLQTPEDIAKLPEAAAANFEPTWPDLREKTLFVEEDRWRGIL